MDDLTKLMREHGKNGWCGFCMDAADEIERLRAVAEAAGGLQAEEIATSGTHERWKRTANAIAALNQQIAHKEV